MKIARMILILGVSFFSSPCSASFWDGGHLTGYNLLRCIPFALSDQKGTTDASIGAGPGFMYYEEDSKFWYGTREQYSGCMGAYAGGAAPSSSVSVQDQVETYRGTFVYGNYMPWGLTLLPGSSFTPQSLLAIPSIFASPQGLLGFPMFYLNIGLSGMFQSLEKVTYTYDFNQNAWIDETENFGARILIGPNLNAGVSARFYVVDFFAELNYSFYLGLPSGTGLGLTYMAGIGFSLLK